jgi:serine/threonine protein phosphatase PrpC
MLISMANENGGLDNITVLLARYDSEVTSDE